MKNEKTFLVECNSCNGKSKIKITNDEHVTYIDTMPIISSRKRRDLNWGFECFCGNDTRMCKEEFDDAPFLLKGSSGGVVAAVIDKMRQSQDDSFVMTEL